MYRKTQRLSTLLPRNFAAPKISFASNTNRIRNNFNRRSWQRTNSIIGDSVSQISLDVRRSSTYKTNRNMPLILWPQRKSILKRGQVTTTVAQREGVAERRTGHIRPRGPNAYVRQPKRAQGGGCSDSPIFHNRRAIRNFSLLSTQDSVTKLILSSM